MHKSDSLEEDLQRAISTAERRKVRLFIQLKLKPLGSPLRKLRTRKKKIEYVLRMCICILLLFAIHKLLVKFLRANVIQYSFCLIFINIHNKIITLKLKLIAFVPIFCIFTVFRGR